MYQTPTKRLTDLLSGYLDFDQKQLHLGLWRGDLEIQNVNLKNEAFDPILNTWKQNSKDSDENQQSSKQQEEKEKDNSEPSIASFLTKELLLSSNPSRSSHLDVKLIKGSIQFLRAVVPWKSILIGSRDSKVKIELKGVTIRLGLESCVAKALENDEQGLYGVCKSNIRNNENDERDVIYETFHSREDVEHGYFREWKQNLIRTAEQKLDDGEDVPLSIFDSLEDDDKSECMSDRNKDDKKLNVTDDGDAIENASSTFIERFVRSFASNLGWRVGKCFEATVEDLKIILVHDDVEVGFVNKSLAIYEFDGIREDEEKKETEETGSETNDDCSVRNDKSEIDEPEIKRKKTEDLDGDENRAVAIGTHGTDPQKNVQDSIIRKSIKILGSGLFVRKAKSFVYDNERNYIDDPPNLDDHILLPTDVGIIMTLRRDGSETNIKIEKDDAVKEKDSKNLDEEQSLIYHTESVETNEVANTSGKKRRRGKRDKRRDINVSIDSSPFLNTDSFQTDRSDYLTVGSLQRDFVGSSFDRVTFDETWDRQPTSFDDISSPEFSIQVSISTVTFVFPTRSCLLLNEFVTKIDQLKIGRPGNPIPTLYTEDSVETFVDTDSQASLQSQERKEITLQWWSYALFNVLKDLRIKKYHKKYFAQTSGSQKQRFNWLKHKRLKREYVSLFLKVRLQRNSIDDDFSSKFDFSFGKDNEERLLLLEDKLSVEQILLFRAYSKSIDLKDAFKFIAFDKIPSSLLHPLESEQRYVTQDVDDSVLDRVQYQSSGIFDISGTHQPQNTHRRHKSLFTMENTEPSEAKHRRGMTLAYDGVFNNSKSADKEIYEVNFGLHSSSSAAPSKPPQQTNFFSSIEEEGVFEENFEQAFQGNISSLVTISMKSCHLFLCEKAKLKSSLKSFDQDDDISILTSNTFEQSPEKQVIINEDINQYKITDKTNVFMIHGDLHEVILSSVVHQTRLHWESKSKRNIQVLGVEGFCCRLMGSSFISSGTLRCLSTSYSMRGDNQTEVLSIASLPHYPFYVRDGTIDSFLCCELQTLSNESNPKASAGNQDSIRIQMLISKIYSISTCEDISRGIQCMHHFGISNQSQHLGFPSTRFDKARVSAFKQKQDLSKRLDKKFEMNVLCEMKGAQLTLEANDHQKSQLNRRGRQDNNKETESCDICVNVDAITFRQGTFLSKSEQISGFFKSFPDTKFINSLFTMSKISIKSSSYIILDEVLAVDILCSLAKSCDLRRHHDVSKVTTSVNLSSIKVKLSKERLKKIYKVLEGINVAFSSGVEMKTSNNETVFSHPRIDDQAGISSEKVMLSCPLIDILVVDDLENENFERRKTLFIEIIKTLLEQEGKFRNRLEKHKTREAILNVAFSRLNGLGFDCITARAIIETITFELENFDDGEVILQETEQHALLIQRLLSDFLTRLDERDPYLLSLSFGVRCYLEKLVYDWRVSVSLSTFTVHTATGLCLLQCIKPEDIDKRVLSDHDESLPAISINIMKNEFDCVYGEGGSLWSIYADDNELEVSMAKSKYENNIFVSVGQCDSICSDEEVLKAIVVFTDVFCIDDQEQCDDRNVSPNSSRFSTIISGEISKLNVLFCRNDYIPFMEISLGFVLIDIHSNPVLFDEGKAFLITAGSKLANILDLSYEGRKYDHVIRSKEVLDESLSVKVAISSDARKFPSELLIAFNAVRLTVLRRFVNDLLQYMLSPDYGLGRILSFCFNGDEHDESMHPLWFQLHFNDCSIILPQNSESNELMALTASKIVLANGFEESSWNYPKAHPKDAFSRDEKKFSYGNTSLHQNTSHEKKINEEFESFDSSLIMRMHVTATDVNAFTGISSERLSKNSRQCRNLHVTKHFLDFNDVTENGKIFTLTRKDGKDAFIDELIERKWEKVTVAPLSLEVISDFLPSHLRVLIRDFVPNEHACKHGLWLDLRMSQFYAILSTWYENMQELPVLFPYSDDFIEENVSIPTLEPDWPEYGTDSFVSRMTCSSKITFEIAVHFSELKWHCKFDNPDYFEKGLKSFLIMDFCNDDLMLLLNNFIVQVDFDIDGVMRTGLGATSIAVKDKRQSQTCFERALEVVPSKSAVDKTGSINMTWGLDCTKVLLSEELDFQFQASILMTPDRWCLINLGIEELETCTVDLAFIWILQEYFSSYFIDGAFGNPYFAEKDRSDSVLRETFDMKVLDDECLNIDFRVWLLKPCLKILSNPFDLTAPAFVLKSAENGLFYRLKTIGYDFSSQEIYAKNLDMMRLKRPDVSSIDFRKVITSGKGVTMLVRSLNIDVIYDQNIKSNHTDIYVNLAQSFDCSKDNIGIEFSRENVRPIQIPVPKICKPSVVPSHELGIISCEIDLMSPEYFIMAFESLYKFTGPSLEEETCVESAMEEADVDNKDNNESSFSLFVDISGLKIFISDPLLGVHMPILVANVPELHVNCSQLRSIGPSQTGISNSSDLQACVDTHFWVDYYKSGPTRSWEPLMEPYKCKVLFEKSMLRGQGITVSSECPLHINFSGAFFETLIFAARSFKPHVLRLLGIDDESMKRNDAKEHSQTMQDESVGNFDHVKEIHERIEIDHEKIPISKESEATAFSLTNLTGDQIRYHQQQSHDSGNLINYLHHGRTAALDFPATRSLLMNLKIVEIPVFKNGEQILGDASSGRLDSSNYIDLQIPGFNWSRSIPVDVTCKRFVGLEPKSSKLQAMIANDWRLANALSILTDVSFYEGRRQVTLTSSFEMLNRTTHEIQVASHINPTHIIKTDRTNASPKNIFMQAKYEKSKIDECNLQVINPGETVQVPILLLESALQQDGKNLGSFWLRPLEEDQQTFIQSLDVPGLKADEASIGFCSNPMHISHIVEESALMYRESGGNILGSESFSSGYQLSCPIVEKEEENISPFCYCIEVKRSPLVAPFAGHNVFSPNKSHIEEESFEQVSHKSARSSDPNVVLSGDVVPKSPQDDQNDIHGPVAYSLEIHPPMIIENFLPEKARYELMHATRKKVVWSSELMPGESVPIYTVGLDAPLLLLIHLGYCRTPVGEGALVHHGSSDKNMIIAQKDSFNGRGINPDTMINAVTKLQLSTETRAGILIGQMHENDKVGRKMVNNKRVRDSKKENTARTDADEPFHQVYSIDDIATETTVVDHLGQKLNLYIENQLGGGGQRRITIYCPYWIINTTDHALRYRQEKTSSFVSGTMTDGAKDGSRFVDLRESTFGNSSGITTIFPGKSGALSRSNLSVDEFAGLMEKDMSLQQIASMAFMFNFRDFLSIGGYERKLSIQLADPTGSSKFSSDWSNGVSLESVGVSQTISMHCMDGRHLEIAMTTRVAPGRLSAFTKIVRLSPKYVLVNHLDKPIRLWQDSSLIHPSRALDGFKNSKSNREPHNWREKSKDKYSNEVVRKYDFLFGRVAQLDYREGTKMRHGTVAEKSALYITTAGKGELIPFHLPDTKFERELRIDLGRKWNLTASFASDIISDYTFKLSPVVDLRLLKYVDNRASARYVVQLPPQEGFDQNGLNSWDGELGLWFETIQWSHGTKIVVKGTKRGKYSINNTDIHAGDELVQIDETPVSELSFSETMKMLKERLSEILDVYRSSQLQSIQNSKKNSALRHKKPKFLQRFERSASSNVISQDTTIEQRKGKETLTLVFQTLEHRMKKLRGKALGRKNTGSRKRGYSLSSSRTRNEGGLHKEIYRANQNDSVRLTSKRQRDEEENGIEHNKEIIQVSMKHLNQSIFVFVHKLNLSIPYKIENRSLDFIIYFRQRGCEHHQWNILPPGDSLDYSWEEPMKPQKLTVRVGTKQHKRISKDRTSRGVKNSLPFNIVDSEDHAGFGASRSLKLDEIGNIDSLPCPIIQDSSKNEIGFSFLHCQITAEGKTKKLVVSDNQNCSLTDELKQLEDHLQNLTRQILQERQKYEGLLSLKKILGASTPSANAKSDEHHEPNLNQGSLPTVKEDEIAMQSNQVQPSLRDDERKTDIHDHIEKSIVAQAESDIDDSITSRHQVMVEVVEASGLRQPMSESNRSCNPYCTVRVIRRIKKHRANLFALKPDNVKRTYYINQSDSPKWSGMKFVFNVSPEAELDPQGFSVLVKVKDFRLVGKNGSLGMTEIRLHNLKHQKEVFGWYPLMARTGRGGEIMAASAEGGKGSVKLRVQWVYSVSALLDYYLLLSQKHLSELSANCEGMKHQLANLKRDEEVEKEMKDILSKSSISIINDKTKKILHTSAARSVSKQGRNTLRWSRQKDPINDLSLKFDHVKTPEPESVPTNKNALFETQPISRGLIDMDNEWLQPKEMGEIESSFSQDEISFEGKSNIRDFKSSALPPTIQSMKSWLQASILLNINSVRQLYDFDRKRSPKRKSTVTFAESMARAPYPTLIAPLSAPKIVQDRKESFLETLYESRENFEKAAQRSLRVVSNPGGWLRIRPITALYLPSNGFSGMYVKLRYGSEAIVSRTVPTPVNPEWSSDNDDLRQDRVQNQESRRKRYQEGQVGTPASKNEANGFLNGLMPEESQYFSNNDNENDLEINVQALKTDGSLRLSVVGVKVNSKEELGVLHIPLADAICCCTENYDDQDTDGYVRWYPLTDPKWTDSVDVDVRDSHRSVMTEEKHSEVFSRNYTKCIKLAMWWEKDEKNTLHISNPRNNANKLHNFTQSYFHASLNGISAAIIDSFKARELLSIAFTNIDVRNLVTKPKTWFGFALGNIQIDHHDKNALEPVVLGPTPVMHPQPTIQFLAEKDNIKSKSNIDSFKHIAIQLEELDLRIEENWVFDLWDMYTHLKKKLNAMQRSITRSTAGKSADYVGKLNFGGVGFTEKTSNPLQIGEIAKAIKDTQREKHEIENEAKIVKKIYIDELMLGSVKLNITYTKSLRNLPVIHQNGKKKDSMTEHRRAEIFRLWSELGHDEDWTAGSIGKSRSFPEVVSAIFPPISAAPVRVNGKALNNVFETWSELVVTLKNYYSREIILQFYKIVGSVDIVGNPTMFVNSLLKGARDFVVIPIQEFLRSPKDPSRLGIGVAKGTLSLFSHSFSGLFGFVSRFTESMGSAVATLSLDEYFKRWHAEQAADQARHRNLRDNGRQKTHVIIASAIARPVQDIVVGVYFATSGIIVEPYIGARNEGFNGLARGLLIGGLGIVTKPIVGILDAFAHVSGSINDAARSINFFDKKIKTLSKRRYPYTFGCNNILQPYDAIDARTASLLRIFPMNNEGQNEKDELLVMSEMLLLFPGEATYIAVTTRRIVLFEVQIDGRAPPNRLWQNEFEDDVKIISCVENFRHSGYVLRIKRHQMSSVTGDNYTENNANIGALVPRNEVESSPGRNMHKSQQQNFKKIYKKAGALLPSVGNVAFNSRPDYKNPAYVEVLGEFAHSKELTRVHNAICCLTKQFDLVIHNSKDTDEGCTSFKSMHFVDESTSGEKIKEDDKRVNESMFNRLEQIPWVHFRASDYSINDTSTIRRKWKYSDELNVSKMKGGPSWVVQSRARSTFIPMEFPSLPPGMTFEGFPVLKKLKDKLDIGELSLDEVERELSNIVNEGDIFDSAHEFPSMKTDDFETFKIEEIENENDTNRSSSFDSFLRIPDEPNIVDQGLESVSTLGGKPRVVDNNGDVNDDGDKNSKARQSDPRIEAVVSNLSEQRLANVEQMLESLMNQMNEYQSTAERTNVSHVRAPPNRPSLVTTGTSMVSALSNSDNFVDGNAIKQNDTRDREQLLQEIEDLKQQLAYVQLNSTNYVAALNETTSTSTGIHRQKKKRKRKLIKKPWK